MNAHRVALVTGGSGGLGAAICRALARDGLHVIVAFRNNQDSADAVVGDIRKTGGSAEALKLDVADRSMIFDVVDQVGRDHGRLDVLVNNAASYAGIMTPFLSDSGNPDDDLADTWTTNVGGPLNCSTAAAKLLAVRGSGHIVNVSALGGVIPVSRGVPYAISKAALDHLTRCMADALAPDIIVNGVAPGFMMGTAATDLIPASTQDGILEKTALGRPVELADVARVVVEFSKTRSITGQTVLIDGGRSSV